MIQVYKDKTQEPAWWYGCWAAGGLPFAVES